MTESQVKLYWKLLEIQKSLKFFKKEKSWYNFKYTEWALILAEVRWKMDDLWLILKQEIIDSKNTVVTYAAVDKNWKEKIKTEVLVEAVFKFTWLDAETWATDENIFRANWFNDFDKGMGSAATYWERYFLLKYFHIPTDEDDNDKRKKVWEKAPNVKQTRKNAVEVYTHILWDGNKDLSLEEKNARVSARLGRQIEWATYSEAEAKNDLLVLLK